RTRPCPPTSRPTRLPPPTRGARTAASPLRSIRSPRWTPSPGRRAGRATRSRRSRDRTADRACSACAARTADAGSTWNERCRAPGSRLPGSMLLLPSVCLAAPPPEPLWTTSDDPAFAALAGWSSKVELGDVDSDGDLDVVIPNGGDYSSAGKPEASVILINDG